MLHLYKEANIYHNIFYLVAAIIAEYCCFVYDWLLISDKKRTEGMSLGSTQY